MSAKGLFYAFVSGAATGAIAALLLAPQRGRDLRANIREVLREKGILATPDEIDLIVERLTAEQND